MCYVSLSPLYAHCCNSHNFEQVRAEISMQFAYSLHGSIRTISSRTQSLTVHFRPCRIHDLTCGVSRFQHYITRNVSAFVVLVSYELEVAFSSDFLLIANLLCYYCPLKVESSLMSLLCGAAYQAPHNPAYLLPSRDCRTVLFSSVAWVPSSRIVPYSSFRSCHSG